jgi:hypothetical protein
VVGEAPAGGIASSATDLVTLARLHIGSGVSAVLPPEDAAQMRQPVPGANPFGLADGWGLGLAVFSGRDAMWVGHDGNSDGTSCYFRVDPVGGWVVALTSNSNSGGGLWRDVLDVLARNGVPIEPADVAGADRRRIPAAAACNGTYVNGDMEYVVSTRDGRLFLSIDGDAMAPVTLYDDFTFSLVDPNSGQVVLGGRFVRDRASGAVDGVQVGGRHAARRRHTQRESARRLVA